MAGSRYYRVGAALLGCTLGLLLAALLQLIGHPAWMLLPLLVCAVGPSIALTLREYPQVEALRRRSRTLAPPVRPLVVVALIALNLAILAAFGINPRLFGYLPLLLPVIASAVMFGFGSGLLAVVLSTIAADYFFARPEFAFVLSEWEDAAGLAVFAILGALVAMMLEDVFGFRDSRR